MGVILSGFDTFAASLRNTAERSSRGAREALQEGAENIKKRAIEYAYVDIGNLEKAIKTATMKDSEFIRRNMYVVYVDEDMDASTPDNPGKTVGDYAFDLHEGNFRLGPKSREKRDATGKRVGPKFLERAYQDFDEEIRAKAESKVTQGIGH